MINSKILQFITDMHLKHKGRKKSAKTQSHSTEQDVPPLNFTIENPAPPKSPGGGGGGFGFPHIKFSGKENPAPLNIFLGLSLSLADRGVSLWIGFSNQQDDFKWTGDILKIIDDDEDGRMIWNPRTFFAGWFALNRGVQDSKWPKN